MLWLLLACTDLVAEPERAPSAYSIPTTADGLLTVEPIIALQAAPERFHAPLHADLSALSETPWEAPPRMHLIDGLCYGNPRVREQIREAVLAIDAIDDAWADWPSLLGTCFTDSYCQWASTLAQEPEAHGRLFQRGLARCGEAARPVLEGETVLTWALLDWYADRARLGAGSAEPLLYSVVDHALATVDVDPLVLAEALGGWDHPESAERLLRLHAVSDDPTEVALYMTRQSEHQAQALADMTCAYRQDRRCDVAWRRPGSDWVGTFQHVPPHKALAQWGSTTDLIDGLDACVRTSSTELGDTTLATDCLSVLSRVDRSRAAGVASETFRWTEDARLQQLLDELPTPLDTLRADLGRLGFLGGEVEPAPHEPGGSLDLLIAHGEAVVLTLDGPDSYLRRLLWLAGHHDLPVDRVSGAQGLEAVHVWIDGKRLRVVHSGDSWQAVVLSVALANRVLAELGDSRRMRLTEGWPAAAVLGEPSALAALPSVSGIRWREPDPELWEPVEDDTDLPLVELAEPEDAL